MWDGRFVDQDFLIREADGYLDWSNLYRIGSQCSSPHRIELLIRCLNALKNWGQAIAQGLMYCSLKETH